MKAKDKKKELIDKIFQEVMVKLKDPDDWNLSEQSSDGVVHRIENIHINRSYLTAPDTVQTPQRYKYKIRRLIRNIQDHYEYIRMSFIFDYLKGVYPHYFRLVTVSRDQQVGIKEWMKTEVGEKNYKIVEHVIYFERGEDHALFVLKWV